MRVYTYEDLKRVTKFEETDYWTNELSEDHKEEYFKVGFQIDSVWEEVSIDFVFAADYNTIFIYFTDEIYFNDGVEDVQVLYADRVDTTTWKHLKLRDRLPKEFKAGLETFIGGYWVLRN